MIKAPINMIIVQIISAVLLGTSCREVYFPEDLEQNQPILSVHGILYEDSLPVVKLAWTIGYYEEAENPVNNATVIVSDDSGRVDTLTEIGQTGLYTISGYEFSGTTGMVYTLRIETEDGNIFMSNPVKMPAKPVVENFLTPLMANSRDSARKGYRFIPTFWAKVKMSIITDSEPVQYNRLVMPGHPISKKSIITS
jgi:hypothetical protein